MAKSRVLRRICCLLVAMALFAAPLLVPAPVRAEGEAPVLGASYATTSAAFAAQLADPTVGSIVLTSHVDASALDWKALQKGPKTIQGATGNEQLKLPLALHAAGPLSFDRLTLVRGNPNGAYLFAGGHSFRLGPGILQYESFIVALYGGGDGAQAPSADITLEGGRIETVVASSRNGTVTGNATVTLAEKASVGAVYKADATGSVAGAASLTLRNWGTAAGFVTAIPVISNMDHVRLDNTYLRLAAWDRMGAGTLHTLSNSALWLEGTMTAGSRLQGYGGKLVLTGGSRLAFPDPAVQPGWVAGRFQTSLSAGPNGADSALLLNGAAYADSFVLPEDLLATGDKDLTIQPVVLTAISIAKKPETAFWQGEALRVSGGRLRLHYSPGGVTKDIDMTTAMVTGYNPQAIGYQTLTVTYGGKATTYEIWVADPAIQRFRIHSLPSKTTYFVDDAESLSGGRLEIRYKDGKKAIVPFTNSLVTVRGFDSSATGDCLIEVLYNNQPAGSYWITVRSRTMNREEYEDYLYDQPVALHNVPDEVEEGESFTISARPFRNGDWVWDRTLFTAKVDDLRGRITLTARKTGRSWITYSDGTDTVTETVTVVEKSASRSSAPAEPDPITWDPGPPTDGFDETPPLTSLPGTVVTPPPPAAGSSSPPPASSSSRPEISESSKSSASASATEPRKEPVAASGVPEPVAPEQEKQEQNPRLPVVAVGLAAAAALLVVGGIVIWRVAVRKPF